MTAYFVTGAGGFVGGHLVERLVALGRPVIATDLEAGPVCRSILASHFRFLTCDLLRANWADVLATVKPAVVVHLAAQSLPRRSWSEPHRTFEVNVQGTVRLLEAVRVAAPEARVVVVTSSAVYAPRSSAEPIREDCQLDPVTPYGISKLAQDHVARVYGEHYGLRIIRARPFYLIGPRKAGDVSSDFARGIVAVERGLAQELPVGALDVVRDFLDVRDGVDALIALAERGESGAAYNVSSGRGIRVGDLLETFLRLAKAPIVVKSDPQRMRPLDEPVKIADNSRLCALGWMPRISLEQSVADVLAYWRSRSVDSQDAEVHKVK